MNVEPRVVAPYFMWCHNHPSVCPLVRHRAAELGIKMSGKVFISIPAQVAVTGKGVLSRFAPRKVNEPLLSSCLGDSAWASE